MDAQAVFPAELASAARARHHAEGLLRAWGCDALIEPARLLVSELVVNAVLHARSEVAVRIAFDGERLRVEVADESPAVLQPTAADPTAVSGRGLMIVEAVASRWGVDHDGHGKVVWFELDPDDAGPPSA